MDQNATLSSRFDPETLEILRQQIEAQRMAGDSDMDIARTMMPGDMGNAYMANVQRPIPGSGYPQPPSLDVNAMHDAVWGMPEKQTPQMKALKREAIQISQPRSFQGTLREAMGR